MNNWFKIGLPVLIAILLVVSAVAVTLAVTGGNSDGRANVTAYQAGDSPSVQYASGAYCYDRDGYGRTGTNGYGPRYGDCPGWGRGDRD